MSMFDLKQRPEGEAGPRLRCLGGQAGPAELRADLEELAALPEGVRRRLWEVISPYLRGGPSPEQADELQSFCAQHALDPARLVGPIRSVRFLLQASARAASTEADFVADLEAAAPQAAGDLAEVLVPCFRQAIPELRLDIVARSLGEHGRLVDSVSWRLDNIVASEYGAQIDAPVAVLTFGYREGARQDRVTLSLLPDQLARLGQACRDLDAARRRR